MEKNDLTRFGVAMSQSLVEEFDQWCQTVGYDNRSQAIRDLVRKAILAPEGLQLDQLVAGTIALVYDHQTNDLSMHLTELQHQYHRDIVSTMHIHLNEQLCLEVIVVRGKYRQLKQLSHRIQVQKGVLFAELSVTHIDTEPLSFDTTRAQVFDRIAPEWEKIASRTNGEQLQQLIDELDVTGKVVLDVGTGTGVLVATGLEAQPKSWIACDLSEKMLDIVRHKYEDHRVQLLQADVHQLPLEACSIDIAICHQSFPHFHSPKIALAELFRVVKPGGHFVINHFAGCNFINQIHSSAEEAVLHHDLLQPAIEVSQWIQDAGFVVTALIDQDARYFIHAVKVAI